MQIKIHINGHEEMTMLSFAHWIDDRKIIGEGQGTTGIYSSDALHELRRLLKMFAKLLPDTRIKATLLDHSVMKSERIFDSKLDNKITGETK